MTNNPADELDELRVVQSDQLRVITWLGVIPSDQQLTLSRPLQATELDLRRCAHELLEPNEDLLMKLALDLAKVEVRRSLGFVESVPQHGWGEAVTTNLMNRYQEWGPGYEPAGRASETNRALRDAGALLVLAAIAGGESK